MQQVKSCSPNDAKSSAHIYISPQSTKVAISIRLGMDQGQPWKPLWSTLRQAEDSYYVPMHCGCKQDCKTRCKCAAANFPCAALCYSEGGFNIEELDDSIRIFQPILCELLQFHFCSSYEFTQSCRNTGLRLLNRQSADFSRVPLKHIYHHFIHPPPVHKVTMNTIKTIINLLLQLTRFYDFDLVSDLLLPLVLHDRQILCFSVKNLVLQ